MKPAVQPVFGMTPTGPVFPRTTNMLPSHANVTLRAAMPGYEVLCSFFRSSV